VIEVKDINQPTNQPSFVSDIAVFVLKRDTKLQRTNQPID